ncbi:MAG: hypothetical protein LVQ95_04535 [Candidatus Micrarchaeales archaeon]|nr:hypothetical protein [Candidatus Micrarchaeales archaeon]
MVERGSVGAPGLLRLADDKTIPSVAMDFDNTFFDSISFFSELFRQAQGKEYKRHMFTDPSWWHTFGFLTDAEEATFDKIYTSALTDVIRSNGFLPFRFGAHLLDELAEVTYVDFVTAVPRRLEPALKTLVERAFTSKPKVLIVDSVEQKAVMPYDFYIDDSPKLAKAIQAYNKLKQRKFHKRCLMPAMPYNADIEEGNGVTRLPTPRDAIKLARKEAMAWTAARREPSLGALAPRHADAAATKSFLKG